MKKPSVFPTLLERIQKGVRANANDLLAVEEPLEIRLNYFSKGDYREKSLAVTMRTPGNDFELALGFLLTEGIVRTPDEVDYIRYCESDVPEEALGNIVRVRLKASIEPELEKLERNFYMSSSCGVCGKASIDSIKSQSCPVLPTGKPIFGLDLIHSLPGILRKAQAVFEHTGGLHACAAFNSKGELMLLREDVGRHNAMDKLVGASSGKEGFKSEECLVLVSGRASFELVQKAVMGSFPLMAAVGAPSSLAVKSADELGMTLIGFLRDNRYNIYTHKERIQNT